MGRHNNFNLTNGANSISHIGLEPKSEQINLDSCMTYMPEIGVSSAVYGKYASNVLESAMSIFDVERRISEGSGGLVMDNKKLLLTCLKELEAEYNDATVEECYATNDKDPRRAKYMVIFKTEEQLKATAFGSVLGSMLAREILKDEYEPDSDIVQILSFSSSVDCKDAIEMVKSECHFIN